MDFGISLEQIRLIGLSFFIFISCLCVREYARAWMVDKLGDPNPAAQGRVTLNPIPHLDPWGSIIIPLVWLTITVLSGNFFIFGWGKPVIPNPSYFANPRRGEVLIALAGPCANILLGLLGAVVFGLAARYDRRLATLGQLLIDINVVLAVFNLLPLPPFDGGVLLKHAIGMSEETFLRIAQWSFVIWLLVISFPPIRNLVAQAMVILEIPMFYLLGRLAG